MMVGDWQLMMMEEKKKCGVPKMMMMMMIMLMMMMTIICYLQAFIIAWTSEFIPKMVYKWNRGGGGAGDLAGYINASLSVTNTLLIPADQLPESGLDVDGVNVTECRLVSWLYWTELDPRVAAVKSTKSTLDMSSQVKSYLIPVVVNFLR